MSYPSYSGFGYSGFTLPPMDAVPSDWPVYTRTATTDALAVSLADVREFVGLPTADTSRDTELTLFIKAATRAVEIHCQMSLLDATWRADMPFFRDRLEIAKRPFKTVSLIEYVHKTTGVITTVDGELFHDTATAQSGGMVFLGADKRWPTDVAERHDAVRITFTAGYGTTAADIPEDIRHALMMTVAKMDANRGDCEGSGGASVYAMKNTAPSIIPASAQPLLAPYKLYHLVVA
jgi:uncharacterized phiE125 gp8 family phage protein